MFYEHIYLPCINNYGRLIYTVATIGSVLVPFFLLRHQQHLLYAHPVVITLITLSV